MKLEVLRLQLHCNGTCEVEMAQFTITNKEKSLMGFGKNFKQKTNAKGNINSYYNYLFYFNHNKDT